MVLPHTAAAPPDIGVLSLVAVSACSSDSDSRLNLYTAPQAIIGGAVTITGRGTASAQFSMSPDRLTLVSHISFL